MDDVAGMRLALDEARRAAELGEVPVGAVIVRGEPGRGAEVVGRGHNRRETGGDPLAHAEILALREAAARQQDGWRLTDTTIYVTLEPCAMCAGAIILARIPRVVFGAPDPKAGMVGSLENLLQDPRLNHRCEVTSGVMAEEASELLKAFFQERR